MVDYKPCKKCENFTREFGSRKPKPKTGLCIRDQEIVKDNWTCENPGSPILH